MEFNIKFEKDELDFILNALRYLENENLRKSLIAIKNTRYEELQGMYASKEYFKLDMKNKENMINEQIEAIDSICEKIENEMY